MSSRSEDTKKRLLEAARAEFALFGIAGARTSRIAQSAGVNEALLFRYFGGKHALFGQVYEGLIVQTVDDVPLDASDLGSYAGALFDYYQTHEQVVRFALWAALEGTDVQVPDGLTAATERKESAIASAQAEGHVSGDMPPGELLAVVIQLSLSGASLSPSLGRVVDSDVRRRSVVSSVRTLAADRSAPERRPPA